MVTQKKQDVFNKQNQPKREHQKIDPWQEINENGPLGETSDEKFIASVMKGASARITMEIEVHLIDPNPWQPRKRPMNTKNLEGLAVSIQKTGLIQSIVVRHHPTDQNRYQVACGHRRLAAVKELKWEKIRADVFVTCTDMQMRFFGLGENDQREELHPLDLAQSYHDLLQLNDDKGKQYNVRTLSKEIGKNKDHIQQYKSFVDLQEDLKTFWEENPDFSARLMSELSDLEEEGDRAFMIQQWKENELKTKEMMAIVKEKKRQEKATRKQSNIQTIEQEVKEHLESPVEETITKTKEKVKVREHEREKPAVKPSPEMITLTVGKKLDDIGDGFEKVLTKQTPAFQEMDEEELQKIELQMVTLMDEKFVQMKKIIHRLIFNL